MVRVHPGPPKRGAIAQPGEHRLCKPGVGGSNPPGSTTPPGSRTETQSHPRKSETLQVGESSDGFRSRLGPKRPGLTPGACCSLTTWKVRREARERSRAGSKTYRARPDRLLRMPSTGVRVTGSSEQAHTVDALATTGDERRGSLRKAPGSWQTSFDPEISEWGNPPARVFRSESIGSEGEPGELKHLSTRRNRNQPRFRQ